jgi:hypothetical protein
MLKYPTPAARPVTVGCSLPRPLFDRLERLATQQDVAVSKVMRELLVKALREE